MYKQTGFLCSAIALVVVAGIGMLPSHISDATATGASDASSATKAIILAALTPEQAEECQREQQALYERLNQCTTDECRQSVQAEIDAHNARCQ